MKWVVRTWSVFKCIQQQCITQHCPHCFCMNCDWRTSQNTWIRWHGWSQGNLLTNWQVYTDARVTLELTNTNRQYFQVVPWTSHSALVLSTLALLVTAEVEKCYPTTTRSLLIHRIPAVLRHQLALWVVPHNWSGHWSCGLQTVHSLISFPDRKRHARWRVKQASAAILQESSRHCSERRR